MKLSRGIDTLAHFAEGGATTASAVLCCWVAVAAVLIGIAGARRA